MIMIFIMLDPLYSLLSFKFALLALLTKAAATMVCSTGSAIKIQIEFRFYPSGFV